MAKKQYLVLGRCQMDDVPLALVATEGRARSIAMKCTASRIVKLGDRIMDLHVTPVCSTAIVPFIDGVPQQQITIKEFK